MVLHATRRLSVCLLVASALWTSGCDSADEDEGVVGAYVAEEFTGGEIDVLDAGGSLEMTLEEDGSFTGHIFVPEEVSGAGEEVDLGLDGTYTVSGTQVMFEEPADTFIPDVMWRYENNELSTSRGELRVRMVKR
jgi:hypothetical protein